MGHEGGRTNLNLHKASYSILKPLVASRSGKVLVVLDVLDVLDVVVTAHFLSIFFHLSLCDISRFQSGFRPTHFAEQLSFQHKALKRPGVAT